MQITLLPTDRRRVLDAYAQALATLEREEQRGRAGAAETALALLQTCLEGVTPQTWPSLWVEAQIAMAEAYLLRSEDDLLQNAYLAVACYRAALHVALADVWQWAAESTSCDDAAMEGDTSEI
jgi:hypothetical protein